MSVEITSDPPTEEEVKELLDSESEMEPSTKSKQKQRPRPPKEDIKVQFLGADEGNPFLTGVYTCPEGTFVVRTYVAGESGYSVRFATPGFDDVDIKSIQSGANWVGPEHENYLAVYKATDAPGFRAMLKKIKSVRRWLTEPAKSESSDSKKETSAEEENKVGVSDPDTKVASPELF
jgi:hypothetical protein